MIDEHAAQRRVIAGAEGGRDPRGALRVFHRVAEGDFLRQKAARGFGGELQIGHERDEGKLRLHRGARVDEAVGRIARGMGADGESAEEGRHGVVGMTLQLDQKCEELLARDGKRILDQLGQAHEHAEPHGDTAAQAARDGDVAVDVDVESKRRDFAAGALCGRRPRRFRRSCRAGTLPVIGAGQGRGVVKLEGEAEAIEAGPEIGGAGGNANLNAGTGHAAFYRIDARREQSRTRPGARAKEFAKALAHPVPDDG